MRMDVVARQTVAVVRRLRRDEEEFKRAAREESRNQETRQQTGMVV